jgi:hypothetical protein
MKPGVSRKTAVAGGIALVTVLYGAKAAAFFDPGADAILADILANTGKQLAVLTQSLAELRRSYGEVKRVAEYADDAVTAARSFRSASASGFGAARVQADLDAITPDLDRLRGDALAANGMAGSSWTQATATLQKLSTYCVSGALSGSPVCVQLRAQLDNARLLAALATTFGPSSGQAQTRAVDAEVAAAIRGAAAQARAADLQKMRLRELLRLCNGGTSIASGHEAKQFAEECQLAAQQAQVLHLEEGQETNVRLAEIARLQAIAVEQKNAELKRDLAQREGEREALTDGLDVLVGQRVTIHSGGLQP